MSPITIERFSARKLLIKQFASITGDAADDPVTTGSAAFVPIHPSLVAEITAQDLGQTSPGTPILIEIALNLSNTWNSGPEGSGTEFEIQLQANGRIRGVTTVSTPSQRIPMSLQGWVRNIPSPDSSAPISIVPHWRVLGSGQSYLVSRGYGAAYLSVAVYEA